MATATFSSFSNVCWSSVRNTATKALAGVTVGYRDTLINLLCRDNNETASRFGHASCQLIRLPRNTAGDEANYSLFENSGIRLTGKVVNQYNFERCTEALSQWSLAFSSDNVENKVTTPS